MARSGTSRTHIMPLIGSVTVLALAAIPMVAVSAMPASTGGETQIEKSGTFLPEQTTKTQGFASPESRDLPGFEPVLNAAAPSPGSATTKPGGVIGRYMILRQGGRDTGCMLMLAAPAKGHSGGKAILAPECRDAGIVMFDPAAWGMAKDRLALTARKGHTTHLILQPDGTWRKDPTDGRPLILKKI